MSYFLGLQFEYTSTGIFVHQSKYAQDLLIKFKMLDCKPCSNPCSSSHHLVPTNSPLLSDPTADRSMVEALQYMTFTRLDFSYVVQQACQFMSHPTSHHLVAAKRILRYIKGSLHLEFILRKVLLLYLPIVMQIGQETLLTKGLLQGWLFS